MMFYMQKNNRTLFSSRCLNELNPKFWSVNCRASTDLLSECTAPVRCSSVECTYVRECNSVSVCCASLHQLCCALEFPINVCMLQTACFICIHMSWVSVKGDFPLHNICAYRNRTFAIAWEHQVVKYCAEILT